MRVRSRSILLVAAVCLVAGLASSAQAQQCRGYLDIRQDSTEDRGTLAVHVFNVDVSASSSCAKVEYVFRATEAWAGGTKEIERVRRVGVRDGETKTARMEIKIPKDHRLFNWIVEVERCTPC